MPGLADHPTVHAAFQELMAEKEALRKMTAPLREEYTTIREEMGPLVKRANQLARQMHAIEQPRLTAIDLELAAMARAVGGRSTAR